MLFDVVMVYVCLIFFFFKQKTAYEMRISDWSSDVCSSDLRCRSGRNRSSADRPKARRDRSRDRRWRSDREGRNRSPRPAATARDRTHYRPPRPCPARWRSEEHTSELQSLMRISYAVFCLKKKTTHNNTTSSKMVNYTRKNTK